MTRPADWAPLAPGDPVPGDPAVVDAEAVHLRDVAVEMRAQIAQLRIVGRDPSLIGRSADALRAAATDLSGRLEAVVGRYEQTHAALRPWARALDEAQAESLRILERARGAEAVRAGLDALPPAQPVIRQHNLARVLSGTTGQVVPGDDSGFGDVAGPVLRSPFR